MAMNYMFTWLHGWGMNGVPVRKQAAVDVFLFYGPTNEWLVGNATHINTPGNSSCWNATFASRNIVLVSNATKINSGQLNM